MPLYGKDSMMEFLCPQGVLGSFRRDDCDQSWVFLSTNLRVVPIRKKSKSFSTVSGALHRPDLLAPSLSSLPPVSFILSSGQFLNHAKCGVSLLVQGQHVFLAPMSTLQPCCHLGGVTPMSLPSSPLALAWQRPPARPPKSSLYLTLGSRPAPPASFSQLQF